MRLLHCADLHIGCFSDVTEGIKSLTLLTEAAIKYRTQALLIAGDLFDKDAAYPFAAQRAVEPLSRLREYGIQAIAVEGNHDCNPHGSLRYLEQKELVRVLRPKWEASGKPVLDGCIAEYYGVRVVGLGFLGDQTAARLNALAEALQGYEGATVCMLHTGVYEEGHVPPGGITELDVARCANKIEYIALGHRHGREEHGIAYNPGSPAGVRLYDPDADYGYYLVDVGAGSVHIAFFSTRRR